MRYLATLSFVFIIIFSGCNPDESIVTPPTPVVQDTKLIQDNFEDVAIVVVANKKDDYIVSFKRELSDGTLLSFETTQGSNGAVMKDNEGNKWNLLGECTEGGRVGQQLIQVDNWMGYWFALSSFFPNSEIYGEPSTNEPYVPNSPSPNWLISTNDLYRGAPIDGIVAVDNPKFYEVREFFRQDSTINLSNYLVDSTLVIGIQINGEYKAYPHSVLNWHEIVNDNVGGVPISVIYCPLTGTASAWSRMVDGTETTFGVSGLLYNNNVIPYDRATGSNWQQVRAECINGSQISTIPQTYPIVETRWDTWKQMFPSTLVMSDETPQSHDCGFFPYGTYQTNPRIPFPRIFEDNRRFVKERVHAVVVNGKAKVYPFDVF